MSQPLPESELYEEQRLFDISTLAAGPGAADVYVTHGQELLHRCWADERPRFQCARGSATPIGLCKTHLEIFFEEGRVATLDGG
jgi:hypothetical protein